jgi:predicted RND superfamily exporter protein
VLVVVFGALLAASLPLLLAIVSIAVALGLTAFVAAQWELALFVTNMLIAMGLALGIDYALWSPWSQSAAISANRSAAKPPKAVHRSVAWQDISPTTRVLHRLYRVVAGSTRSQPVRSARKRLL